jgi:hypothetical protein
MAGGGLDQPTARVSLPSLLPPTSPAWYLIAHISDTTSANRP